MFTYSMGKEFELSKNCVSPDFLNLVTFGQHFPYIIELKCCSKITSMSVHSTWDNFGSISPCRMVI